jgi:hypothetical protein
LRFAVPLEAGDDLAVEVPDFDNCPIYAGFSGAELDFETLSFGQTGSLRKIYAHFFAPMMLAFGRPKPEGGPHQGRWAAVSDGAPLDIHAEVTLTNECGASLADKLGFLKTLTALTRLYVSPLVAVPIISNVPIDEAATHSDQRFFSVNVQDRAILSHDHFKWVVESLPDAIELNRKEEKFSFALSALDSWLTIRNGPLALVSIWAAIENIFSPDKTTELRFRVAAQLASYLEPAGQSRKTKFKEILKLYDARSKAAHGSARHDPRVLFNTYDLLRGVIMKVISEKKVPSIAMLEDRLFGGDESESGPLA